MDALKKRGQITIFIIVGIILLLILLVVLFMTSRDLDIDDVIVVPPELLPARNYIDYCKDQAVIDALDLVGRRAGFIELRPEARANPSRRVSFFGNLDPVPYWYYDNANWIPTQSFMEQEMSEYVNDLFIECINDMDFLTNGFRMTFYEDEPVTELRINEKDVTVEIFYPVQIATLNGEISTRINRFYKIYDVRLADMMDLAIYILDYENTYYFLEDLTIGLMSMNDNIPLSGMEMRCGVRSWNIFNIMAELQEMLFMTFDNIRVQGTDYYPFNAEYEVYEQYYGYADGLRQAYEGVSLVDNFEGPEDYENAMNAAAAAVGIPEYDLPSDAYYFFNYYMPMFDQNSKRYENFSVDFFYLPEFGMDIQAKPSSDGILKSNMIEGARKYLSFLCINMYHFTYDVTYPVIVSLNDPDALAGRGYSFRFAFPVIIRNNEAMRSKQHMDFSRSIPRIDDYCHDGTGRRAIVRAYDKALGSVAPIEGVNISMICVDRKCPLGVTEQAGQDIVLRVNITTACANPYIEATKEGYHRGLVTVEDWMTRIDVEMVQMKEFNVDLRKHRFNILDESIGNAEIVSGGEVSISISGWLDEDDLYEDYFVIIPGRENTIELPMIGAEYELSIVYLTEGGDFSGGYFAIWDVSQAELIGGNRIAFHFIEMLTSALDEDAAVSVGRLEEIDSPLLGPFVS